MVWVLIVLVLAAAAGILGAVIKVAAILVLSFVLAFLVLVVGGYYYVRHRFRRFLREAERERRGYPASGTKRPDAGPELPR